MRLGGSGVGGYGERGECYGVFPKLCNCKTAKRIPWFTSSSTLQVQVYSWA